MLTILSNWTWFWILINKTINSEGFSEYVSRFNDWIIENGIFGYKKVVLMFDNCSSHKSGDCMRLFKSLKHQVVFIPAYFPQFAPVEKCFNIVKQRIKSKARYEAINLSSRYYHRQVVDGLKCLNEKIAKNWFKEIYTEIRQCLSIWWEYETSKYGTFQPFFLIVTIFSIEFYRFQSM